MGAPKGNQFWRLRRVHGKPPIFPTPESLWDACCEYFEWVENNPLWEDKLVTFQGQVTHEPVRKMRAMTIGGLCVFLGIDRTTWGDYARRKDYVQVVTRVEEIIREQKFVGAAAELLNPNIIARDLGLADRTEHTGAGGGPIRTEDTTGLELARRVAYMLASAAAGGGGVIEGEAREVAALEARNDDQ